MRRSRPQRRHRTILLAACLALALAAGGATSLAAEPAADAQSDPAEQAASSPAKTLKQAEEALAEAQARSDAADAAYSRMRHSNRPRGAAREAIVQERTDAHKALAEAQERYEALGASVD